MGDRKRAVVSPKSISVPHLTETTTIWRSRREAEKLLAILPAAPALVAVVGDEVWVSSSFAEAASVP